MNNNEQNIVVGALVQWTEAKTYGVVTDIDRRMVYVRWDEDGPPRQFAAGEPPLLRASLQGQTVRLMSRGDNAVVLTSAGSVTPAWQCFVATGGGITVNVPEADLRPLPLTNPVDRFRANLIGSLQQYRLQEVTRWYRVQHLYNELVSLGQVGVDIKPHQVSVVHKVVSNYPHRFMLCDEVGLGKTIEAGMALKEIRARGGGRRALIIAPPNIVRQWQFEMRTKFNESFSVLNTNTVKFLESQGQTGNPFTYFENVVCSSGWIANPRWAKMCAEVDWDLVIVDEAHHARVGTRLYRLVRDLAAPEHFAQRGVFFLTATPMQLHPGELYSLVELLDPALFPSQEHFERHRLEVPGLSRLVERLHIHGFSLTDEDSEETVKRVAQWLELDADKARQRLSAGREEIDTLTRELSDRHLLSEVLIRNRKVVVGGFMPRSAYRWEVELTSEERKALETVENYVQYGFQLADGANNNAIGFVMVIFQKLMASSIAAIKESLRKRRERIQANITSQQSAAELEERLEDDDNVGDVVGTTGTVAALANEELSLLNQAIEALDRVISDSKSRVLVEKLAELFRDHPDEKVLVFTQFRETQRHLGDQIANQDWGINLFHGQMRAEEKDRAVEDFRNRAGPQVLVSTEAGGEGRNLQFCHLLVNYDLPWNPMRVEQRIGRVDRIGQEQAISIFNLWVKGTIEARVLDVLENRIRLFEETVGGLDAILGETESDIQKIMRRAGEERERALEDFGNNLEGQVRDARDAERRLGDFIMDTKSYQKELAERIAGQPSPVNNDDFERFVGQLLNGVRTYIRRTNDVYDLTFHNSFVDTHKPLFPTGDKRKAVFRPDRWHDSEGIEFMAFGHPIVDSIVEQVLEESYEGVTGTRSIPAGEDLVPTSGWLFTYQFTIPGPQSTENLFLVFVSDDGKADLETGRLLVQRACQFNKEENEIDPSLIPNNLHTIEPLASQAVTAEWESLQQQAQSQAAERVDREGARLKSYFDYRERNAQDKVADTQAILYRLRESDDEAQRQILPVWEANLRRNEELRGKLSEEWHRRLAETEKYRQPQVAWALKSLSRIEIVAPD